MRRALPLLSSSSSSSSKISKLLDEYHKFHLPYNVTLIGPPGSGKGTYGRLLSVAWNQTPIYSVSDILRQHQQQKDDEDDNDNEDKKDARKHRRNTRKSDKNSVITSNLNTGTLVDCEVVSQIVLSYLQAIDLSQSVVNAPDEYDKYNNDAFVYPYSYQSNDIFIKEQEHQRRKKHKHFIMDGYPRTQRQIDIMVQTWPVEYHMTHAIHLDIPDSVCEAKILGRRQCVQCLGAPNVANVQQDGFDLPPLTPMICRKNICRPNVHWVVSRPDDTDKTIVQKRLFEYRQQESALLDYYNRKDHGQCISVTPYHGIQDFPKMQQTVESWFLQQQQQQ